MHFLSPCFFALMLCCLLACQSNTQYGDAVDSARDTSAAATEQEPSNRMIITNLHSADKTQLHAIQQAFAESNPGYALHHLSATKQIGAREKQQVLFVQAGGGTAETSDKESSKISVGDIILLAPEKSLTTDSLIDYVLFESPEPAPTNIPTFIRPDWDPNITDTPGGCATETNAYRRILLTWLGKVGPYLYKSLNAHRVRIMDSFTHYHPIVGGFDEFYLVQMALPDARIITSQHTKLITDPDADLKADQISDLVQETPLKVGDLLYLPRGVIHRGVGGVLAQVITIPGFVPNAEIGVDHHLRRINEQFVLTVDQELPLNELASREAVVK